MAVLTGLTPGSMYTVQVFAVAEDNVTQGSGASLTVFTKPETILNLTAEDITTTSITLTWSSALSGVVHYKVKIPGTTLPDLTVYSETATISQLIPGRNYTVEVSAVDGDNFTEGDAASLTVSTVPGNILGLTAENITTKSFSLTWNLTEGVAVGYNVQVTGVPDFDTRVDSEMAVLTGLTPGSMYTVQVFAVAEDNVTQGSGASLTVFTKPETILNLTAEDITTTSITLTWSSALSGVVHYKVKIPGTTLPDLTVYSETATISQLIPGGTTRWKYLLWMETTSLKAMLPLSRFPQEKSAKAALSLVAPFDDRSPQGRRNLPVPGNILGLTAENITTKSFSLTWNLTEGVAVGYNVQVTGVPDFDTRVDSEMAVLTGLTPGSMYTVQVFAVAEDNVTQGSGASLTVFTKPETILNLTAEDITTTSITLTWSSALSGVVHYKCIRPATISQLIPGRNYTVEVSAVDGDNFTEGDAASLTVSTDISVIGHAHALVIKGQPLREKLDSADRTIK
ncbi:receptor-type tyrosine-protein phosphatase eta-like [Polypterus senegalus]|uniref:receptor-type tyrosine-protein phosphatase eta-like n=1 Tax=Polypterus senegalus TaxID=55291 RepID=UPI001963A6DC|nr:receptor-type tyrosine-protein phosphatase eta-like [Polypterus senegalus]